METFAANPNSYDSGIAKEIRTIQNDFIEKMSTAKTGAEGFKALDELKGRLYEASRVPTLNSGPTDIAASKVGRRLQEQATQILEDKSIWGNAAVVQQKMNGAYTEFVDSKKAFDKFFRGKFGTDSRVTAKKIIGYAEKQGIPESSDAAQALDDFFSKAQNLRQVIIDHGLVGGKDLGAQKTLVGRLQNSLEEMDLLRTYEQIGGGGSQRLRFGGGGIKDYFSMINPTGQFAVQVLGATDRAIQSTNTQWLKTVGKAAASLSTVAPASAAVGITDMVESRKTAEDILQLAANPQHMGEKLGAISGQLEFAAPTVASRLQQMNANAVQFLAQKAPANPNQDLYGQQKDWKPSDADMGVWNRYLTAAQDPMVLLHHFSAGTLAPETVETVKTLYPNLYAKSVGAITQYLAEKQPTIPYSRRLQLSVLLQAPVEPALKQSNLFALQMSFVPQEGAGQGTAMSGSPVAKQGVSGASQAAMTPGQRLGDR